MKRKLSVSTALALLLLAILTTYLVTDSAVTKRFEAELRLIDQSRTDFQKLAAVDRIVRENYVAQVDETLSSEGSIAGYLAALGDPRCEYFDREEYESYKAQAAQKTGSCGIVIGYEERANRVYVLRVSDQAAALGVSAGDEVLQIGSQSPENAEFSALESALTGPVGEKVTLLLSREGEEAPFSVDLNYGDPLRGVSGRMCLNRTAYFVFDEFSKDCSIALRDTASALIEQGADVLIFDVRGVAGTDFEEAAKCIGVVAGNVELARRVVGGASETITGDTTPIPLPCAVLIDENTQGAGELFAAGLKDTRGALIVGARSFGNASVQALIELSDQTAIRLTTKLYLPPKSDSFDQKGVEPDLTVIRTGYRAAKDADDTALNAAYELLKPRRGAAQGASE